MAESAIDVTDALRGAAWPALEAGPMPGTVAPFYPRANPADAYRMPIDTWLMASVPAGVRIELDLDAGVEAVLVDYEATNDDLGYRGDGAGITSALWTPAGPVSTAAAAKGANTAELTPPAGGGRVIVYIPEGMKPRIDGVRVRGGNGSAATPGARWLCYGDSIAEGWSATEPARSWPMIVARANGLDVVNLGYAGSARGELISALHLSALEADIISLAQGTNCWSMIPHSAAQISADYNAFLDVVRSAHPTTPVVCVSPVIRPDAESTKNVLDTTLAEIRETIEGVVTDRQGSDPNLTLVEGGPIIDQVDLVDGIHPGDDGHEKMAAAIGPSITV